MFGCFRGLEINSKREIPVIIVTALHLVLRMWIVVAVTVIVVMSFVILAIWLGMVFNESKTASVTDNTKMEANATVSTAPAAPVAKTADKK